MRRRARGWSHTSDNAMLQQLQRETFNYFLHESNPANGLVFDRSKPGSAASIAAVGLALSAYPVGVERSFISRPQAVRRTLATLRFFWNSTQGRGPRATGYKGFYYHFLSPRSGRRAGDCEISTIDTALLLAGALTAAAYFDRGTGAESEIRKLAFDLYARCDWQWALNGGILPSHGWKPGRGGGFLPYRWEGYSEALLLYVLGLGSPTHPLPESSYRAWTAGFEWKNIYGRQLVYAGPLFIHQLSQVWLDLRGMRDAYMRRKRSDYFENSRRATLVQQEYARRNPGGFAQYSGLCWGITASDGPGNATRRTERGTRPFYGYLARGVPYGPDDGTVAPWAAATSLPFAPEIVLPAIRYFERLHLRRDMRYGFAASFNPSFPVKGNDHGWVGRWHCGLNQGPVVLMIENFRTGLPWRLMRGCPYIAEGLRRAGFRGSPLFAGSLPLVA